MRREQAFDIVLTDPTAPELSPLFAGHAAHGAAHYPAESNHEMDPASLATAGADFFLARETRSAAPLGMAALLALSAAHAELKSMHVLPQARGRGVAAALLQVVLDTARRRGFSTVSLETGSREASAAARRLYARHGFKGCAPFGSYIEDPESVFMTLALTRPGQSATPAG